MRDNILKIIRDTIHNRASYSPVSTHEHSTRKETTYSPSVQNKRKSENHSLSIARTVQILFSCNGKLKRRDIRKKWAFLTLFIGIAAVSIGTLLVIFSPYEIIFKIKATFAEGGEGFELWRKPPVNVYLKVYLFNITNREAFLAGREKLKVQEVGPYVYREYSEHANISFHHHNGTLTSVPKYPLQWVPELSVGKEDDVLVLPNVALLSIANVMANRLFLRSAINLLIKQTDTQPLVEQTAKEFMFGYKSTLVTLGNQFLPSWIVFDKLGLIDRMYDFEGDTSTVYTGETDIRKAGLFHSYNYKEHLPQWDPPCNKLTGSSDGTKFPSLINPEDSLLFYRKSLCRVMPVVSTGEAETVDGVLTTKYTFPASALDNGETDPNNKCFCRNGECLRSGLLDVTDCYYGFPIALSFPHFYMSDPTLLEEVEGPRPIQSRHETYFNINQETGTPARVAVRMQINIALQDVSGIANTHQFSNRVIPLLWTEIEMPGLPTNLLVKLFLLLRVLPVVETLLLYLLMISGISFVTLSICALVIMPREKPEKKSPKLWRNKEESYKVRRRNSRSVENGRRLDNKEMDVYYCSLLLQSNSDNDDDKEASVRLLSAL